MNRTLIIGVIMSFLPNICMAGDLSFKLGVGIFNSAVHTPVEVKVISATYQMPLINKAIIQQFEAGYMVDVVGGGRSNTAFGFYSAGLNIIADYVYMQALTGVGGITTPDSYLGGNFQFTEDLSIGLRDREGHSIGLNYKHISSAGIYMPNIGRDMLMFRLTFPIGNK